MDPAAMEDPWWGQQSLLVTPVLACSRALITGPEDTPYANGCFLFDIHLSPEYPNRPPNVHTAHNNSPYTFASSDRSVCL